MEEVTQNLKDEHVLVCLSSAPSNARIIRTAADMAKAYGARFTALFVETADFGKSTPQNKSRLAANIKLAEELGAEVETVFGDDIAYQIARFSEAAGITKLVLGRSTFSKKRPSGQANLVESLLVYAPEVEIHIIPDKAADVRYTPKPIGSRWLEMLKNAAVTLALLGGATAISFLFQWRGFSDTNMIMLYTLAVLLTSFATSGMVYSLISSIIGVVLFNCLFADARFSLDAFGTGYPLTFIFMFLTAFISGTLAQRYKRQASRSNRITRRLKLLFDTNKLLLSETDRDKILTRTAEQLIKLFEANVLIFDEDLNALYFPADMTQHAVYDEEIERRTAEFVINNYSDADADPPAGARFAYLPLRINDRIYGAVGIDAAGLSAFEHDTFMSVLLECAIALDNERNRREKEQVAVVASNEQLRANILRSISHDLRTPLTSISGNAANLLENGDKFDSDTRKRLLADILKDSEWLISLTENLLASTRMEDGRLQLRLSDELISDIVDAAVNYCAKRAGGHTISVLLDDGMMFVSVDVKLIVQVLVNLIDNSIKYTPDGSLIEIRAVDAGDKVLVSVADDGDGIAEQDKPHIFEKFYSGGGTPPDSRRSMGLGLYLCKAVIEAHGGEIWLEDNVPHGAVISFTLAKKEIKINE